MIDEANMSLEESGTPSHEIMVIVLHREFTSGSIGITLAGGADYECKDITVSIAAGSAVRNLCSRSLTRLCFQVHKVIPGTLADRDGRIQKGDRVLSINGRSTKGVGHREALSILKVRMRNEYPHESKDVDINVIVVGAPCRSGTRPVAQPICDPGGKQLLRSLWSLIRRLRGLQLR